MLPQSQETGKPGKELAMKAERRHTAEHSFIVEPFSISQADPACSSGIFFALSLLRVAYRQISRCARFHEGILSERLFS